MVHRDELWAAKLRELAELLDERWLAGDGFDQGLIDAAMWLRGAASYIERGGCERGCECAASTVLEIPRGSAVELEL